MRYPKKLKKGDTVGLICMSSPISRKTEDKCRKTIEKMGYVPKLAGNLSTNYGGYMAGTGKERAEWINKMFADPTIDAIFCVRGGDAGSRVMEYVDFDLIKKNPKIFVGYSDVTSMHNAINKYCDLVTFHGPMVSSNMIGGLDPETEEAFFKAINADNEFDFINPKAFDIEVLKSGKAEGEIVGGNLALLSASIGTTYEIDTKDKILFIEEVGETMNRVERFAYQLRNSGKFAEAKGIILGQFTNCENKEMSEYDEIKLFSDVLEKVDIPVMYNIQSGHGDQIITIPFGAKCIMDTETKSIKFVCKR